MGDLLAVERDEATLVWQAQAQGLPVEHRSDINPVALLGIVLVTAPRATNGHASYDLVQPGRLACQDYHPACTGAARRPGRAVMACRLPVVTKPSPFGSAARASPITAGCNFPLAHN
jgi:hypothetical protein